MWELRISANASPYGFLGFVINSTLNILSARGLAHSERQRNVKNVAFRNTELHNTKKAIYFTTSKTTFIKHPKCEPVLFCAFGAQNRVQFAWAKKEDRAQLWDVTAGTERAAWRRRSKSCKMQNLQLMRQLTPHQGAQPQLTEHKLLC